MVRPTWNAERKDCHVGYHRLGSRALLSEISETGERQFAEVLVQIGALDRLK